MNADKLVSNIPKAVACVVMFPIALLLVWLSFTIARESHMVETSWRRVKAKVVDPSGVEKKVTLEWFWKEDPVRREVERKGSFARVNDGDVLPLWVNPANLSQVRLATFAELWGGVIVTGAFAVIFGGVGFLVMRFLGGNATRMPQGLLDESMGQMGSMGQEGRMRGFPAETFPAAGTSEAARAPDAPEDDGRPIEMREPSESWKANVFWGLLFGLLLLVPPLFASGDPHVFKRFAFMAAGIAWMVFMGRCAIQNRGRTVRCDASEVMVSQPFGSLRIPLREIKKVTRRDVREHLRKFDRIGRSSDDLGSDNIAPMVVYILYDATGKELLRLDQGMQPDEEMHRFLARMKALTGGTIADE